MIDWLLATLILLAVLSVLWAVVTLIVALVWLAVKA